MIAVAGLLGAPTAGADHGSAAAKQAAREIQDARDRANAAAQALFDTESEIDALTIEIAETEQRLGELESAAGAMRESLETIAVRRFTQSGGGSFFLLDDLDEASNGLTADVLTSVGLSMRRAKS